MITEETEEELRRSFTRAAAEFDDPGQARQRVLQREYHPGRGRHRLPVGVAAVSAVAAAAALALTGAFTLSSGAPGPGAAGHTPSSGGARPVPSFGGHTQLAGFSLVSNGNGTTTLTLGRQALDPAALQRALAQHGIRAVVRLGSICYSAPAPYSYGVFSATGSTVTASTVLVINPARLPAGTEVSFGYFLGDRSLLGDVMNVKTYTCTADPSQAQSVLYDAYKVPPGE